MGYFSFQEENNMSVFFFKRPFLSTKWWTETIRISPWILDRDPSICLLVFSSMGGWSHMLIFMCAYTFPS